jgi:hypothetical protein
MPRDHVPWSLGRDFDTEPSTPHEPRLTGVAQAGFEVNLVTQDNPAQLHREPLATFGRYGVWITWSSGGPRGRAGSRSCSLGMPASRRIRATGRTVPERQPRRWLHCSDLAHWSRPA